MTLSTLSMLLFRWIISNSDGQGEQSVKTSVGKKPRRNYFSQPLLVPYVCLLTPNVVLKFNTVVFYSFMENENLGAGNALCK